MSAVDAPPGLSYAGLAAGEFVARRRARTLSRVVFIAVCILAGFTMAVASRRLYLPAIEVLLVGPVSCILVAALGIGVRAARIRISTGGVAWKVGSVRFGLPLEKLDGITAYEDAIAVRPRKGSTWFLGRRDWEEFERMLPALRSAKLPLEVQARRAPWRARLQSYGRALDIILLLDLALAAILLVLALR